MAQGCLTDTELAAHLDGLVHTRDVAGHLDNCSECRAVVAAAARLLLNPCEADTAPAFPAFASPEMAQGTLLGRYRIIELIGAGGMGRVYRAVDHELDREVALKVLRPELARRGGQLTERLLRESRLMAKVSHPNVITVFDVGRTDTLVYVAMELFSGQTLTQYLLRKPRRWLDIYEAFERAARGLAAAHRAGIVHRDFKPDNVLVATEHDALRRVVVTDFGVARTKFDLVALPAVDGIANGAAPQLARVAPALTATGVAIGTPAYMAPEQFNGGAVDERADVFALAASLWEAIFATRPFFGRSSEEIVAAMQAPVAIPSHPAASRVIGTVPGYVIAALLRGLQIDPAARTPSVEALIRSIAPRQRRARMQFALGGAGLACVAIFFATRASAQEPAAPRPSCTAPAFAFHDEFANTTFPALVSRWAPLGVAGYTPIAALADRVNTWQHMYVQSCLAPNDQQPQRFACLAARQNELTAVLEEAVGGPLSPNTLQRLLPMAEDPSVCETPYPATQISNMPSDPTVRRAAQALRYELFRIEDLRDRGDVAQAITAAQAAVKRAATITPRVHAEALYTLGTLEDLGGDVEHGATVLREAAKLAEQHHHDYVAAGAWIALSFSDANRAEPGRAIEYTEYAEAAVARMHYPPLPATLLAYARGLARVRAGDFVKGEADLKQAFALAQTRAPALLDTTLQGLGYYYEEHGDYGQAADLYREGLQSGPANAPATVERANARSRMAFNMAKVGLPNALAESARAIAELERMVGSNHPTLMSAWHARAEAQQALGEHRDADRSYTRAGEMAAAQFGAKSLQYAVIRLLRAVNMLEFDLAGAAALARTTCQEIAYLSTATSLENAECRLLDGELALRRSQRQRAVAASQQVLRLLAEEDQSNLGVRAHWLAARVQMQLHQRHLAVESMRRAEQWMTPATPADIALAVHLALAQALEQTAPTEARTYTAAAQQLAQKFPRLQARLNVALPPRTAGLVASAR